MTESETISSIAVEDLAIGRVVRDAREDAKMTQGDFARAMNWPGHNSTISLIESGQRSLKFVEFVKMAKLLHRDPHDLLDQYLKRIG